MKFLHVLPTCASVALLSFGLSACQKSDTAPEPIPAPSARVAVAPKDGQPGPRVPEAVQKFLGRWVRADGGYVLELKNPDLSGKLEAAYLNPKPINVSRAIWMQGGSGLQVAVELNDVGYPGATYMLSHDAATDRLQGQYTQPQMQQTFDVEFIRQNAVPLR